MVRLAGNPFAQWARQTLIVAVVGALIGLVAYQVRAPMRLPIGSQDSLFIDGFYQETDDAISHFRWTKGDAKITLYDLGIASPLQVSLHANSMRPGTPLPIQITINGRAAAQFNNSGWQDLDLAVPASVPLRADHLTVGIKSDVFTPSDESPNSNDTRDLGVAIAWVQVQPLWQCSPSSCDLGSLITIPSVLPLLELAFLSACVFLQLLMFGASYAWARSLAFGASALVGIGLAFWRIQTTEYLWPFTILLGGSAALVLAGQQSVARRRALGLSIGFTEAVAGMLLLFGLFQHVNHLATAFADPGEDGQVFFTGAVHMWRGVPLYDVPAMRANLFAPVYKLPAFYAIIQMPYRWLGVKDFIFWFRWVNEGMYLVSLLLLARLSRLSFTPIGGYTLLLIGLAMDPAIDTLRQAQSGLLILFLLTLSLIFLKRRRDGWGGILIALAFMIKLYPGFFLLPLLLLRRVRALLAFALAVVVLFGLGIVIGGWSQTWVYLTQVLPLTQGGTPWVESQSLYAFLSRFFTDNWGVYDFSTPELKLLFYVIALAFLAVSVFVFVAYAAPEDKWLARISDRLSFLPGWHRSAGEAPNPASSTIEWGFALFSLTLLIVAPLTWNHYLPTAILAVPPLLAYWRNAKPLPIWSAALFGVGIVLIAYGIYPIPLQQLDLGAFKYILVSYRFYGLVLLWLVTVHVIWAQRRNVDVRA